MPAPILHVIYAGRGDAMILECDDPANAGARQYILVDGGPRCYVARGPPNAPNPEAPYYRYLAAVIQQILGAGQALTKVIISHPDEDHYGGYMHLVNANPPQGLCLFLPNNQSVNDNSSAAIVNAIVPPLLNKTAPSDTWLFRPVKAIFPDRTAILYCRGANVAQRLGEDDAKTYNTGLSRNARSILMYTSEGHPNEMPIFFTGDGDADVIAEKMAVAFPNPHPKRFAIYKIQHHGAQPDNSMKPLKRIKYHKDVAKEAFIFALCKIMTITPRPKKNATIERVRLLAEQIIGNQRAINAYWTHLLARRRAMQATVETEAFNANNQWPAFVLGNPQWANNTPGPVPSRLYERLYEKFMAPTDPKKRVNPFEWVAFQTAAYEPFAKWQEINKIRQFYWTFEADVYVVSANKIANYGHPKEEVLLGLALAVRAQNRRARLYLTSGYSVYNYRLSVLVESLYLVPTIDQLFCGDRLTLWYLSVGPYMSIDGTSQGYNNAVNVDRDLNQVTRPWVFTDQDSALRLLMDTKLEGWEDDGVMGLKRVAKCRIWFLDNSLNPPSAREVYPTLAANAVTWNLSPAGVPGNNYIYVELANIPTRPNLPGVVANLDFLTSEFSPDAFSFGYSFSQLDQTQKSMWNWYGAGGNITVVQQGPGAAPQLAQVPQPGNGVIVPVYIERVFDFPMNMMMAADIALPEVMPEPPSAVLEDAQPSAPPLIPRQPILIQNDLITSLSTQPLANISHEASVDAPLSLQQVLKDTGDPFSGADTVDLIKMLIYLFGDAASLKQTLGQMPQMILQAGFTDLDVNLVKSTAVTTMSPVLDKVISSATMVCQTNSTSKVQWPAKMELAGLALSLDQITVTVENCQTKNAVMKIESAVSFSSATSNKSVLQLGMSWTSSPQSQSDSGPIISFKAGVDSISDLIKALSDSVDDLKGILDGQIPLISKPSAGAEAPTLDKPTGPVNELGFSLRQPISGTSQYEIFSIWIKTEFSGWSSYLPVPTKFDKIVGKAFVQVLHPFQSQQRAVGASISIEIPIPTQEGDLIKRKRNLTAALSASPLPGSGDYSYRFSILEFIEGVSLIDVARVAQEFLGIDDLTGGVTGSFPGFAKVVDAIRVRELGFSVGKSKDSGWSFDEWVVELSIPSFEILPGMLSLVDTSVRVQRFYEDGISVMGEAVFQSPKYKKRATVGFALPTVGVPGYISFRAPGGLNLGEIFDAFDLGQVSQVPVLADIATIDILSCELKFVKPKGGSFSISSFSAELRKMKLELGPLTFEDLDLKLMWQRVQKGDSEVKDGQVAAPLAAKGDEKEPETMSSYVTLNFSTFISSIDSLVKITYDGNNKALTGSLSSISDSSVSLGQILQAPVPGSGKASSQDTDDSTGSFLTAYFDQQSVDALAEILDGIKIRSFGIEYSKSNDESSFIMKGVLGLGPVDLSLTFTNSTEKSSTKKDNNKIAGNGEAKGQAVGQQSWAFVTELTIPTPSTTPAPSGKVSLGELIGGLMDEDMKDSLPPFVSNIQFERPKTKNQVSLVFESVPAGQGSADGKAATASAVEKGTTASPSHFVFFVNINVFGFSFSYTQCRASSVTPPSKSPSGTTKPAPTPTKRVVSVSLNEIPTIDLPLIGEVPKPVDQILYLWIQDTSEGAEAKAADAKNQKNTPRGLTYGELKAINKVRGKANQLVFKKTQDKLNDNTIVLAAGHHFMMTGKDALGNATVILDYVFSKTTKDPKPSPSSSKKQVSATDASASSTISAKDDASAKAPALSPYKKSAGPLSISNIGFGWKGTPKNGTLSIIFDASIVIGPIGFALLGFKLEFDITADTSLQNLPDPKITLDGLAASFNKPPLTIAGAFMHKVVDKNDIYAGALLISYSAYLFQAAGFYGNITDPQTGHTFKSAFMFCRVNGPLMSVGWAELSGLVAGLGYNSSIRFPTAAEIPTFPLIAPPASSDPLGALTDLMDPIGGMITPRLDSFWVAAGVKVTAFQVLKVDAVLVLSFDPSIKIGIFGLAVADLPPAPAGSGPGKFVHVELGVSATVDVALGVMKIEGQLTPASYVLDPSCHLTGGFAMYSWFDSPDPDLNGDWVFTIGGYHRSFHPPAHYPVPPRLGISWSFSSHISITGEAYFAITPKMCMGGGRLDVTLRAGPLRAWFNAYADFLINYKPFHFIAEGGVSVGVECVIDFCIASVTIGATLGATLYLEGPPMSGRITVDFWVTTFDVNFGSPPDPAPELTLGGFFDLVLQGGQSQGMLGGTANADGKPAELHVFSCQSGLVPNGKQETPADAAWVVRGAAFAFNVACLFAIANCTVVSAATKDEQADDDNSKKQSWGKDGQPNPFPKPMKRAEPLLSDLEIKIYREESSTVAVLANINEGQVEQDDGTDKWDKIQRVIRPLPSAMWGPYNPSTDPSRKDADQDAMLSSKGGTVNLMTGVDIHGPDAKLSSESAIEFNVAEAMGQNATLPDPIPTFPDITEGDDKFLPVIPSPNWEDDSKCIKKEWQDKQSVAEDILTKWTTSISAFSQWDTANLQAQAPSRTIKKFDDLYLEMPWLTATVPTKVEA